MQLLQALWWLKEKCIFFKKQWKHISKPPMAWIVVPPCREPCFTIFPYRRVSKGKNISFPESEGSVLCWKCVCQVCMCVRVFYIGKGSGEIFGQHWGGVSKASVPAFAWVSTVDRRINRSFHALKKVTKWVFDSDSSLTFEGWKPIRSFTGTRRCKKRSSVHCHWRPVFVQCLSSGMFSTGAFFSLSVQHCFIHWDSKTHAPTWRHTE